MKKRIPDFENNLLRVVKGQKPDRATLFEFAIDHRHQILMAGHGYQGDSKLDIWRLSIDAMANAGYDYIRFMSDEFSFRPNKRAKKATINLGGDPLIYDWESFEKFVWPDVNRLDYSILETVKPYLPDGMKVVVSGPDGVLESVMNLLGYDNLCILLYEEPELVEAVFNEVGSRILRYYENSVSADTVGMLCCNDDWGFNTQTFLPPDLLRKYVFPWHKKYVDLAHRNGKPCMLHSCGYYNEIIDDVINDMKYDARHSYEDNITPVEKAYADYDGKIAVLGGIDVNYLATKTPDEIYKRCRNMLEMSKDRGGYALGSGNSVTEYVPYENYLAMLRAAQDFDI